MTAEIKKTSKAQVKIKDLKAKKDIKGGAGGVSINNESVSGMNKKIDIIFDNS
jgi:hypothetical protein